MKKRYMTVHNHGEGEIIINKSRFIGYTKPVESEEDALEFIEEIKEKHKDATHNVFAYVIGEDNNIQRYSDDGEPSGTAGIPILEILKKEDLRNTAVVVTRYFGGIKLGVGGLVRAYIKGAKVGLDKAEIVCKVLHNRLKFKIDYTLYGKVENELLGEGYEIESVEYDSYVHITVLSAFDKTEELIEMLKNLSSGTMDYEYLDDEYISVLNGEVIR